MGTAADSLKTRESAAGEAFLPKIALRPKFFWPRLLLPKLLERWHLLSLDAPTVAALWSWFFARALRIGLPWHAPLLLAIGTWLVYAADRIFDGVRDGLRCGGSKLQQRHLFHARHRRAFLAGGVVAVAVLLWLIVAKMSANARYEDTVLFSAALLYLLVVHTPALKSGRWLPKELAVGFVFAAATAVPAWSRLAGSQVTWSQLPAGRAALAPAVAVFAALCWLNCVAIERWENPGRWEDDASQLRLPDTHPTTRWTAERFRPAAFALATLSGMLALGLSVFGFGAGARGMVAVHLAVAGAALVLAAIDFAAIDWRGDRRGRRIATLHLRIAADLALLTPLLFLAFL